MFGNTRRIERERVLSLLYEAAIKGQPVAEVIEELPVTPDSFVVETITGVDSEPSSLDEIVNRYAIDWKADRMSVVDRTILRIGIWELLHRPELSVAVVITEAVELAKRFSAEESGSFVNGILAAAAADIR